MLSPFPWIDFPEPRCPQFPVSVSPRLRTTLDLRDFRGAEPSTSYRRLTQIRIDNFGFPEQSNSSEVTKAHVARTPLCPFSIVMICLLLGSAKQRNCEKPYLTCLVNAAVTGQVPLATKRRDGPGYPARPARTSIRIAARIRLWPLMLPDRASVA